MNQVVRKFEVIDGSLGQVDLLTKEPTKEPLRNSDFWVSSEELARLADVTERGARKAIAARRWRGADLEVREVASNVGRGGKILQVHVDSLPADLRKTWYLEQGVDLHEQVDTTTSQMVLVPGESMTRDARHEKALATAKWRLDLIRPALAYPKNSKDRRARLDEAVATPRTLPNGKVKKLTRRTLENWVKDYETDSAGLAGLMPKGRSDKGTTRGTVTLAWDAFFLPHVAASVPGEVRAELEDYIKSLWASGAPGWPMICQQSTTKLIEISHDLYVPAFEKLERGRLGDACGAETQFGICAVSRNQVEPFRDYQKIAIKRKDNAVWQDKFMPSLRRDYSDYRPNDIVVGDVHPVDIVMKRPDGTKVYPKAISWLDVATNRIYMTFMLCEQREGVRREYVAQSFVAMVAAWGMPRMLYLDNGAEYNWDQMISGFTELSKLTAGQFGLGDIDCAPDVLAELKRREEAVIRSEAYNAKGKPAIEGAFGNIEQVLFSTIPGWTAGDRMNKKTHAKGKEPEVFPGDAESFTQIAGRAIEHYNKRPQHGRLNGRSPNECLRDHIADGWGKTALRTPEILSLAFSDTEVRTPDRGRFTYKAPRHGQITFYGDCLLGLDGKITVRVPAWQPDVAFCFDGETYLGTATPEETYGLLDPRGLTERSRRVKVINRKITTMTKDVSLLDMVGETERHLEHLPEAPEAPVAAQIDAGILERLAIDAEETRKAQAGQTNAPRSAVPEQFKTGPNEALANFTFAEEEE